MSSSQQSKGARLLYNTANRAFVDLMNVDWSCHKALERPNYLALTCLNINRDLEAPSPVDKPKERRKQA